MLRHSRFVVLATAGVSLLLAGCVEASEPGVETVTNAPTVATATQATATPSIKTKDALVPQPLASGEAVKAYVKSFSANGDPEAMRTGLKSAAPGSVAYNYLSHLANVTEAGLDGGQTFEDQDVTAVGSDQFRACSDPSDEKSCVTLGGFKVNPANLVVDLKVNGEKIAPRLTAGNGRFGQVCGCDVHLLDSL